MSALCQSHQSGEVRDFLLVMIGDSGEAGASNILSLGNIETLGIMLSNGGFFFRSIYKQFTLQSGKLGQCKLIALNIAKRFFTLGKAQAIENRSGGM